MVPDETEETRLPQFVRSIGVVYDRYPIATELREHSSIGILASFAGVLLNPSRRRENVAPTFSYLSLQPLVVKEIRQRERTTGRNEHRYAGVESDSPREVTVRHLLQNARINTEEQRAQSSISDNQEASAYNTTTDRQRERMPANLNDGPSIPTESVRSVTVIERGAPRTDTSTRPHKSVRNVTRLDLPRQVLLELADQPSHSRGAEPMLVRLQPERTASRTAKHAETTQLDATASPTMIPSISNTTENQVAPMQAISQSRLGDNTELQSPHPASPDSLKGRQPVDATPTSPSSHNQSTSASRPKLTLATAPSSPNSDDARTATTIDQRESVERARRRTEELDGPPLSARTEPTTSRSRPPRGDTTMTAVLEDTTAMNRFVDRLYSELEKKTRIERERRGF